MRRREGGEFDGYEQAANLTVTILRSRFGGHKKSGPEGPDFSQPQSSGSVALLPKQ